jgi:hypothetical protein
LFQGASDRSRLKMNWASCILTWPRKCVFLKRSVQSCSNWIGLT